MSDADKEQAEAEKRKAIAEARKAELEASEYTSASAVRRREAEREKAIAEAEKEAAAARSAKFAALIPDFSKVERGELQLKGELTLFGTALAQQATEGAALTLVEQLFAVLDRRGGWTLLITDEADLATSDAAYRDVVTGVDQLIDAAATLLVAKPIEAEIDADALAAIAGAVPAVLSLFAAHRTVSTAAVTADDLAAAAAVAGALKRAASEGAVVHDDFRLLPDTAVHERVATLSKKRQQLMGLKLELEERKGAGAAVPSVGGLAARLGLVTSLLASIDQFVTSLTAAPEGAKRSPLSLAALREQLHTGSRFTHVLLLKSVGGSTQQTIDDRPLWFKDKFSVVATISLTYVLIGTADTGILAAGTTSGAATGHGTIGREFDIKLKPEPA